MKHIVIILLATFVWQKSFALFNPEATSLPISSASLEVLKATGIYENTQRAYIEKWSETVSSFFTSSKELNKNRYSYRLVVDDVSMVLGVVSSKKDACGSVYMSLIDKLSTLPVQQGASLSFTLVDHGSRVCKDLQTHQWVIKVEYKKAGSPSAQGTLVLGGNPQAIYTIMVQ